MTLGARVRMLEIGGGILFAALLAITVLLLERIDSRFDRVDEPLDQLQASIAAQTATLEEIDRRLTGLENRNGDQPSGSDKAKPN